jgi:hypothetical protein
MEVFAERTVEQASEVIECLADWADIMRVIADVCGAHQALVNIKPPRDTVIVGG